MTVNGLALLPLLLFIGYIFYTRLRDSAWPCGLCGTMVTDRQIDGGTHACCGCGYRDPRADGTRWTCPVCG